MWNLLGDYDYQKQTSKITGTYYWNGEDVEKYYWNLFDGVIVSAEFMDALVVPSIQIHTTINQQPLIKTAIKNRTESFLYSTSSDHLPVSFIINLD